MGSIHSCDFVASVLTEYVRITSSHLKAMQNQIDPASILLESFSPMNDLASIISRYRTGPFRPSVIVFEPLDRNISRNTVFGLDLKRWAFGTKWMLPEVDETSTGSLALVPIPLRMMLARLEDAYARVKSFEERRKIWIYEVSLHEIIRGKWIADIVLRIRNRCPST